MSGNRNERKRGNASVDDNDIGGLDIGFILFNRRPVESRRGNRTHDPEKTKCANCRKRPRSLKPWSLLCPVCREKAIKHNKKVQEEMEKNGKRIAQGKYKRTKELEQWPKDHSLI